MPGSTDWAHVTVEGCGAGGVTLLLPPPLLLGRDLCDDEVVEFVESRVPSLGINTRLIFDEVDSPLVVGADAASLLRWSRLLCFQCSFIAWLRAFFDSVCGTNMKLVSEVSPGAALPSWAVA